MAGPDPRARWPMPSPGHGATIVAKQILLSWKVAVRCEGLDISGILYKNKLKSLTSLCQRMNTNHSTSFPTSAPWASSFGGPCSARGPGRPRLLGPPQGVWRDPAALRQESANGGSCCPQGCACKAYIEVCLPRAPGSGACLWSRRQLQPLRRRRGRKRPRSISGRKSSAWGSETDWKECGEENWQLHSGPQDSWTSGLRLIKLTVNSWNNPKQTNSHKVSRKNDSNI